MEFENRIEKSLLLKRKYKRPDDIRGDFFRDITAIIHSYPFRRLKHKTQVFFSPKNDHICTRIEHVLHVATISATICKALDLDSDLAWAISLGHDLGHAPFGHVGEQILTELLGNTADFHHEIYSLRVVDHLINYGKGLNLTYAVRDGIIKHCGEKFEKEIEPDFTVYELEKIDSLEYRPATYEGCIVRMSDKIAYLGRDLEDAIQLKIIKKEIIPESVRKILGSKNREIINSLVNDLIQYSKESEKIGFSEKIYRQLLVLKEFNYENIYKSKILSDYRVYFERIIKLLHQYLTSLFDQYGFNHRKYKKETNFVALRFGDYILKMKDFYTGEKKDKNYPVLDYIAGMTDDYAIECASEIMIPKRFEFKFDEFLFKENKNQ